MEYTQALPTPNTQTKRELERNLQILDPYLHHWEPGGVLGLFVRKYTGKLSRQ